ncbi:next to BRCA1 gene 1 protein [Striga asiatica]|uniref:Next to BRCA1 gene 1 protein n=1 Tax=Striga asiatica TaxID=4170 RepID=A0A5A7Q019_STRAF|nr:next to BRCA1 gene 1 protein [Striga asiatica]
MSATARGLITLTSTGCYKKLCLHNPEHFLARKIDSDDLSSIWDWLDLKDCIATSFYSDHESNKTEQVYSVSMLNSVLVDDVSVTNCNNMAPSTCFTKIWRMRNNGKARWAHKTQLVWLGGDKLSDQSYVDVSVPASGLDVGEELDIRVDLSSPEIPGDYIAYWTLVSPDGERFGEHVKVIILVEEPVDLGVQHVTDSFRPSSVSKVESEVINEKIARESNKIMQRKKEDDVCSVDEWEEMDFDDKFMNSLLKKKKKGVNKNKLLKKKNNTWKQTQSISKVVKSTSVPNDNIPLENLRNKFNRIMTIRTYPEILRDPNSFPRTRPNKPESNG